ncbi:MAG TPA: FCD domain-containing protein, partial [Limnochordia bacterium]|nr:FCD domain-containing protein [Limnochordia bacterium]
DLAARFGVSRTRVREALKMLEALKIVEIRHGKGVFVREPTIVPSVEQVVLKYRNDNSMLRALAEARFLIEVSAAELAVRRATPEQLVQMQECIERQRRALARGAWDRALDLAFHRIYLSMVNNPVLADWGRVIAEFFAQEIPIVRGPRFNEATVTEHVEILQALTARDPRRLEYAMRRHLELKRLPFADEEPETP